MRFGKRFAEVSASGRSNEPYVSYKELKHTVSKARAANLIGGGGGASSDEDGGGRDDCAPAALQTALEVHGGGSASSSSRLAVSGLPGGSQSKLEQHQHEFFRIIDNDIALARAYVQSEVAMLEAAMGEWQSSAVVAGLLFTPEQLEDVASTLPFQTRGRQDLLDWLFGMQDVANNEASCAVLLEKYNVIASTLNGVLQYIEVNLTAVRKIFKKYAKKIPAEHRVSQVVDFKAHHGLFMLPMQHFLVAAVSMQRIVFQRVVPGCSPEAAASAVPISRLGQESVELLSCLRGPASQEDVLRNTPAACIDVYAKPSPDLGGGGCPAGKGGAGPPRGAAAGRGTPGQPGEQAAAGIGGCQPTGVSEAASSSVGAPRPSQQPAAAAAGRHGAARSALELFHGPVQPQQAGGSAGSGQGKGGGNGRPGGGAPGVAAAGQEDPDAEGGKSERKRGGRTRGGGRGRRGAGTQQPGQGGQTQPSQGKGGGGGKQQPAGDGAFGAAAGYAIAGSVPAAAQGAGCRGNGMGGCAQRSQANGAVPNQVLTQVPMYVSKPGVKGTTGQQTSWGTMSAGAGRGAMMDQQPCGGKGNFMDPRFIAAMMPMAYWGAAVPGMVSYDNSSSLQ